MLERTYSALKNLTQEIRFAVSPFLAELVYLSTTNKTLLKFNSNNPLVLPTGTLYFDSFNKDSKNKKHFIVWKNLDDTGLVLERTDYDYYSKESRELVVHKYFKDVNLLNVQKLSDLSPYPNSIVFSQEESYKDSPSFKSLMSSLKRTDYASGNRLLRYSPQMNSSSKGLDYNQKYPKELYVQDERTLALVIEVLANLLKKEKVKFKDEQKKIANSLGMKLLGKKITAKTKNPLSEVIQKLYNEFFNKMEKEFLPVAQELFDTTKQEILKNSKSKPADIRDRDGFAYLEKGKIFLNYRDNRLWAFESSKTTLTGYRAYKSFKKRDVPNEADQIHYYLSENDWSDEGISDTPKKPSWKTLTQHKNLKATITLSGKKREVNDLDFNHFFSLMVDLDLLVNSLTDIEDSSNDYYERVMAADDKVGKVVKQPNDIFKVLKNTKDETSLPVKLSKKTRDKIKQMLK